MKQKKKLRKAYYKFLDIDFPTNPTDNIKIDMLQEDFIILNLYYAGTVTKNFNFWSKMKVIDQAEIKSIYNRINILLSLGFKSVENEVLRSYKEYMSHVEKLVEFNNKLIQEEKQKP